MAITYNPPAMSVQPVTDEESSYFREDGSDYPEDSVEPIAIIGLSFKFPQEAVSEDSFWDMLVEKRCASTDIPKDRMNIDAFFSPDTKKQNTMFGRGGHFIEEDFRAFDAPFFSISPAEAATMDPQQRALLEVTYHALENAGIPAEKLKESRTSVHVGSFTSDFTAIAWRDDQQLPKYSATGTASSLLSNRLSWFFGLQGPSITVDTACSSSIVALDLACSGLWSGNSNIGIVAGASMILSPELNISLSHMNMLSRDSRCYSFDHRANGYARGEGFGVLIIKRLSQAIKDGDTIRALVRSTGVNQDGYTAGGVTQPSQESQTQLITETYSKAGLDMGRTQFFEAHGTGTPIGDPTEAQAIGKAFRGQRSQESPLYIGAVKSNIGHLEGSSGIAGLIKTILVLEKGIIPPNANFDQLNPKIDAKSFNLEFPTKCVPWPCDGTRRASINSFGFGGTNAHAVLEDAFHYLQSSRLRVNHHITTPNLRVNGHFRLNGLNGHASQAALPESHSRDMDMSLPKILLWSAADESSLVRLIRSYSDHFSFGPTKQSSSFLQELAFTLFSKRSSLPWKSYLVVNSATELSNIEKSVSIPLKTPSSKQTLGFVFTGQGAQWYAMGRELLAYPVFMTSVLKSQAYLKNMGCKWLLLDELCKDRKTSRVNETEFSQPLSTAIQIALVDLWRNVGVVPSFVLGHSSGEIAAAYSTGSISHESAVKVSYHRGALASKLATSTTQKHSMASIGVSEGQAKLELENLQCYPDFDAKMMTISCINSPKNVTISGPEKQINDLVSHLHKKNVFARKLLVQVGYHSPQMNEIALEYLYAINSLERDQYPGGQTTMVSSVTGRKIASEELLSGHYWVQNMVSPVNFLGAMKTCYSSGEKNLSNGSQLEGPSTWVEVGPHSAFQGPIRDTLASMRPSPKASYNATLVRNRSATETFLATAGHLHCQGLWVDINRVNLVHNESEQQPKVLANLPQYPFDHSIVYWEESAIGREFRFRQYPKNDLLGNRVSDWNYLQPRWRHVVRPEELPWIQDHKVNREIVYPAAGMLAMAIQAVKQLQAEPVIGYEVKDAEFHTALTFSANKESVETQVCLDPLMNSRSGNRTSYKFRIYSRKSNAEWQENCLGTVKATYPNVLTGVDDGVQEDRQLQKARDLQRLAATECTQPIDTVSMYRIFEEIGMNYGPYFQTLDQIYFNNDGKAHARVSLPMWSKFENADDNSSGAFVIHPATLDGLFQSALAGLSKGTAVGMQTLMVTRVGSLWISDQGLGPPFTGHIDVQVATSQITHRTTRCTLSILDDNSQLLLASIDGLEVTAISNRQTSEVQEDTSPLCYHLDWTVDFDTLNSSQILQYCEKNRKTRNSPTEYCQDLDYLVFSLYSKAIRDMKASNSKPLPSTIKYTSWMETQLAQYTHQVPAGERPKITLQLEDENYLSSICDKLIVSKRAELYIKIGRDLPKVLGGEVDASSLVFGDTQLLADFYKEANHNSDTFEALRSHMDAMTHKNPAMNILEVGAGTGGTTEILHQILASDSKSHRYAQYTFSDISPSSLTRGQEMFQGDKRVDFKTLDIEKPPLTQGFKQGFYNIVVAAYVLHGTKSLDQTLQNIHQLLKPGGKLILIEITSPDPPRNGGFVFGLLPDWWLTFDNYRQQGPWISEEGWNQALKANGFSGTDTTFWDYSIPEHSGLSIMISTAVPPAAKPEPVPRAIAIVADCQSMLQHELTQSLNNSLHSLGSSILDEVTLEAAALMEDKQKHHFIMITDLEKPLLKTLTAKHFSALQLLLSSAQSILWVTEGGGELFTAPDYMMVQGLCRVSRQEHMKVVLSTLALESTGKGSLLQWAEKIAKVFDRTILQPGDGEVEWEYVERGSLLHIPRLSEAEAINNHITSRTTLRRTIQEFGEGPPLKLSIERPGLLDSLLFLEDSTPRNELEPGSVEIEVRAVGINFKDCLTALGRINSDIMGSECAGVITRMGSDCEGLQVGDRAAATPLDCYKSYVRSKSACVVKIPDNMSFSSAAAIPSAFCTAYYSFYEMARLQKGESVLIHSASGGTGQAAIQIASWLGAEIFATVGLESKKKLLIETYGIAENHIFCSRDTSFAQGIKHMTQNRGVDVVFNSLSGEALIASWECIAPYGRFLEIGKRDIESRNSLPMHQFLKNVSFIGVDLAAIADQRPHLIKKMLQKLIPMMVDGVLRPLTPITVFSISEIEHAFRVIQSGKSSGKLILEITKDAQVPTLLRTTPTYSFKGDATYLISGGLGGLGRSIARWLAQRGALNILLLSRSGATNNEKAQSLLQELRASGVRVEAPVCDICSLASIQDVVKRYDGILPPIKGCFQASMVLRDAKFTSMTFDEWEAAVKPKVQGSWNLHAALPSKMDFFILLSSISGIFGNAGQSNYAAGNTYQDALAHYRVSTGEKAISIDLGAMVSEGYLAENAHILEHLMRLGVMIPITPKELFAMLDYCCDPSLGIQSRTRGQIACGLDLPAKILARGGDVPSAMCQPLFNKMHQIDYTFGESLANKAQEATDYRNLLSSAETLESAAVVAAEAFKNKLARVLGLEADTLNIERRVQSYGVDSLVSLEMRNWLAKEMGADLAVFEIGGSATILEVGLTVATKSSFRQATAAE